MRHFDDLQKTGLHSQSLNFPVVYYAALHVDYLPTTNSVDFVSKLVVIYLDVKSNCISAHNMQNERLLRVLLSTC